VTEGFPEVWAGVFDQSNTLLGKFLLDVGPGASTVVAIPADILSQLTPGGTYFIKEVDANGVPLDPSGLAWTISFSNADGRISWNGSIGYVTLYNTLRRNLTDADPVPMNLFVQKTWLTSKTDGWPADYLSRLRATFMLYRDGAAYINSGIPGVNADGTFTITGNGSLVIPVTERDADGTWHTFDVAEVSGELSGMGFVKSAETKTKNTFLFSNTQTTMAYQASKKWVYEVQRTPLSPSFPLTVF